MMFDIEHMRIIEVSCPECGIVWEPEAFQKQDTIGCPECGHHELSLMVEED